MCKTLCPLLSHKETRELWKMLKNFVKLKKKVKENSLETV